MCVSVSVCSVWSRALTLYFTPVTRTRPKYTNKYYDPKHIPIPIPASTFINMKNCFLSGAHASKHVLVLLPYLYHQDYELLIYVYWSGILVLVCIVMQACM